MIPSTAKMTMTPTVAADSNCSQSSNTTHQHAHLDRQHTKVGGGLLEAML